MSISFLKSLRYFVWFSLICYLLYVGIYYIILIILFIKGDLYLLPEFVDMKKLLLSICAIGVMEICIEIKERGQTK